MNSARKVMSLSQVISRNLHKSRPLKSTEEALAKKRAKILKEQERFQIDDGTPVYLKGGLGDRVLLGVTYALVAVGMGMSADVVYQLMTKK
ncbi:hypothetical protein WA026_013462 [Henosepilachna vigintioctopunctata]|uniref:Cytochrome c oxidase subunit VIIa n=1 Tax=Henosepilachna vigintioctopunctata TaxID=420089 RepID=A0AAW1V622_9CUCU